MRSETLFQLRFVAYSRTTARDSRMATTSKDMPCTSADGPLQMPKLQRWSSKTKSPLGARDA